MPRTATKRRTSTPIEHRSVKRQKQYATRIPDWDEQRKLGGAFLQAGEGCWPAEAILEEKGAGPSQKYLIKWLAHPKTGEEWEPQWVFARFTNEALKKEWRERKAADRKRASLPPKDADQVATVAAATRRKRNRRVIPDSSGERSVDSKNLSDDTSSPPTLTSRASSFSGPEISETQIPYSTRSVAVKLPPVPDDKSEYESIRPSQLSSQTLPQASSSPLSQILISSGQSLHQTNSSSAPSTRRAPATSQNTRSTSTGYRSSQTDQQPRAALSQAGGHSNRGYRLRSSQSLPPSSQFPSSPLALSTPLSLQNGSVPPQSDTSTTARPRHLLSAPRRLASPFAPSTPSVASTKTHPRNSSQRTEYPNSVENSVNSRNSSAPTRSALGPSKRSVRLPNTRRTWLPKSLTIEGFVPVASIMASVNSNLASADMQAPSINIRADDSALGEDGLAPVVDSSAKSLHIDPSFEPTDLKIHESIEDEPESSRTSQSIESKASSSQESLNQERYVPSVDGVMIPTRPTLGPHEHCFSLPAEGKIKSIYSETIKAKRKAILRFLRRRGSPGTAEISSKKTTERNEMLELLQRLHDATTHFDLGLDDMQTQYQPDSQQAVEWANYAGSKFVALGSMIDSLRDRSCSFVVVAQSGQLQELLAQYILMKHVNLRRYNQQEQKSQTELDGLVIDLLESHSGEVVQLPSKPLFIIAFDSTFTASSAQIKDIRQQYGESLPIVYLLVENSSEHVERCVPESITSNLRLKIVVRTTYLAAPHLGGDVSYLPDESDGPLESLRHDVLSLQRAVKKSPVRKVAYMADLLVAAALSDNFAENWNLAMPELQLEDMDDTPPKVSRAASRTPQPASSRAQTPLSRAATPVARKRLLEQDAELGVKRQRLTPLQDTTNEPMSMLNSSTNVSSHQEELMAARLKLEQAQEARLIAEQKHIEAERKVEDWQISLAELQSRYELRRAKTHQLEKENKKLNATVTALQTKVDKSQDEKQKLKDRNVELTQELSDARKALTDAGGDTAAIEQARQEARDAQAKQKSSDKSLENMKGDFEFMRTQYQDASKKAQDHAIEINKLEEKISSLEIAAADKRRSLKSLNYSQSIATHIAAADRFALEVRNRDAVIKRLQEENTVLKSKRGVQTRGSSAQPNASPGPRSRQASPAAGLLAPPSGSRTSVLRHER